ncbi:hypothetical protein JNZ24_10825 [Streptococcus suis]|nr:hypothetical protein [Streptococcus suis]
MSTTKPTMSAEMTHMRREIEEVPQAVARLLDGSGAVLTEAGRVNVTRSSSSPWRAARPTMPPPS